jgi:isopenicillin-N N-acyltransferase like protein
MTSRRKLRICFSVSQGFNANVTDNATHEKTATQRYELPQIEISGTSREMGRQHGEALRERIVAFIAQRYDAALGYFGERNGPDLRYLTEAGAACMAAAQRWDPEGTEEHLGTAEGAGVDPVQLYAASNMTDVRDVVLLSTTKPDAEGCSSLLVPRDLTADGVLMGAQTWDLNPPDLEYIVAIHRRPKLGPETWSVTCTGCLSLMGMNEHGVAVGTTNIKVKGSVPGVGYLSLLHRAIRCASYETAAEMIEAAPRAAAHTYWLADANGALELEVSADASVRRELETKAIARTNHCIDGAFTSREGEAPNDSSRARYAFVEQSLAEGGADVAAIRDLFADRSQGNLSVSRFPEDDQGTATNACMIAVPERGELWACRGPSQRGDWVRLSFSSALAC